MLFTTFDFLLFIIPALVGFWLLAEKPVARTLWLLVASYLFYMAGPKTEPPPAPAYFAGLLVFSTVLDFVIGKAIYALEDDYESEDDDVHLRAKRKRKLLMWISLAPRRAQAFASQPGASMLISAERCGSRSQGSMPWKATQLTTS